jgi:hypothetical protein
MFNKRNAVVLVLAVVLMVVGIGGTLVLGQIFNPPAVPVVVAAVNIPAGTTLLPDMLVIDNVQVNAKVLEALVRETELSAYLGKTVVEPIKQYEFLRKSAISAAGNPAADHRIALALDDPALVAMVVPVSPETAPDAVVAGDHIDLGLGMPGNTQFGNSLSTEPTPDPFRARLQPELVPEAVSATPAPVRSPEPLLQLPVAKTIVSGALVLAIVREEKDVVAAAGLTGGGRESRTVTVSGPATGLVVAVPREAQELLQFAIDNGLVRVAVLSAAVTPGELHRPTLGMTWNDLVALMRMDRAAALADGVPPVVLGPGAHAIEATQAVLRLAEDVPPPRAGATAQPLRSATPPP